MCKWITFFTRKNFLTFVYHLCLFLFAFKSCQNSQVVSVDHFITIVLKSNQKAVRMLQPSDLSTVHRGIRMFIFLYCYIRVYISSLMIPAIIWKSGDSFHVLMQAKQIFYRFATTLKPSEHQHLIIRICNITKLKKYLLFVNLKQSF